jgi:hypothetical protein
MSGEVINLKDDWDRDPESFVYIGHYHPAWMWKGGYTLIGSKWRNPWKKAIHSGEIPRGEGLRRYEEYVRERYWDQLPELDGKVLACWCEPLPCHGDVLLRLIEERKKGERDEYQARS